MSTGKQPPIMMTASYFEVNHHYMQNKADRAAHAITNDKSIKVKCPRPSSALFDAQVGVKGTFFWDEFSTVLNNFPKYLLNGIK